MLLSLTGQHAAGGLLMCTGVTWGVYGHFLKSRHSSADGATATAIMKSPDPSIPRRQVWHTYACMHACVYVFMYACMYVCVFIGKYRNSNFAFFRSNFNERRMVPKVRTMCRKLCVNTFLLLFVLFSSGHVPPLCHGHGCAFAVQYGDQAAAFHSSFCPGGVVMGTRL